MLEGAMTTSFDLRPYQLETWEKLDEALITRREPSTIMALPTGSGKTLTAVSWLHERFLKHGLSCLWFVHRVELLDQARSTFAKVCPEVHVTEWTADGKDDSGQVVLAMIMSSRNLTRQFDVIVVDEAHHTAMPTYRNKLEELDTDFVLGLTATPTRLDNKDLGFSSIAAQYSVLDLVQEGYLAKPVYVKIRTGQRHRMRMQGGDFSGRSLRQLDNLARNELVARVWAEDHARWGKTLIFCCDIEHSEHLLTALEAQADRLGMPPRTITAVHSRLPMSSRARRVERFLSGRSQVMINVGVFTEGFDCPDVRSIFMARPTASETLYLQMIGRGTRITQDKDGFYVTDFVDELGKYSLLANRWAVQHLGAEDEEDKLKLEADLQRAEDLLQRRGVNPQLIRDIKKDFVLFAGLLEYQGQYDKKPVTMAMTKELHAAWQTLATMMETSDQIKPLIEGSYAWCNVSDTGTTLPQWKQLGWTTFFDMIGQKHKGWVRFFAFQEIDLEMDQLCKEASAASKECMLLNMHMAKQEARQAMMLATNEYLGRYVGLSDIVYDLTYRDQVVTVHSGYRRNHLKGGDRSIVRELIKSFVSEQLDTQVELVLHWAK